MNTQEWISTTLMDQDNLFLERLGEKHILFASGMCEPLLSLYMDPPPPVARWKRCEGMDLTESLFHRLQPWVQQHIESRFFIIRPQDEYTDLKVVQPYWADSWKKFQLLTFEETPGEGGPQYLGFLTKDRQGALIFKSRPGLEIAFYGSAAHWAQISAALEL